MPYASVDPDSRRVWVYDAGEMRPLASLPAPARRYASSLEAARQGRGNLPPSFIAAEPAP